MTTFFRSFHRIVLVSWNRGVVSILFIFMLYVFFGAIVFAFLDRTYGTDHPIYAKMSSDSLIKRMVFYLRKANFSDDVILTSFSRKHFETLYDLNEVVKSWFVSYSERVMLTVMLTGCIGYGYSEPTTQWGLAFCCFYIFFGYAIFLVLRCMLGIMMRSELRHLIKKGKQYKFKYLPEILHHTNIDNYVVSCLFFTCLSMVFILGPTLIFMKVEDWSFIESLYFVVITLVAIGFGDLNAGVSARNQNGYLYFIYWLFIIVWTILGVSYLAAVENLISYSAGTFLIDKCEGKREKRKMLREDEMGLYHHLTDLIWKLNKLCPKRFTKQAVYEEFLDLYVDHPEDITVEIMQQLYETTDELKRIAAIELEKLSDPNEQHLKHDSELIKVQEDTSMEVIDNLLSPIVEKVIHIGNRSSINIPEKIVEPLPKVSESDFESSAPRPKSTIERRELIKQINSDKETEFASVNSADQSSEKFEENNEQERHL